MTRIAQTPASFKEEVSSAPDQSLAPESAPSARSWKVRLLVVLFASLAVLFLLQLLLTHLPAPGPVATNCPDLIKTADYTEAVGFQPEKQSMDAIQLVNDLDGGASASLVQVHTTLTPQNVLDVYIFGCIMQEHQPRLVRLLALSGLVQGDVEVTPQHTLVVQSLDNKLSTSAIAFLQPLQQNIYREYSWENGHFTQLPFAGFYPVTTQREAEMLQQSALVKNDLPWRDPIATALQMSKDLLQWSGTIQSRLLTQSPTTALVELTAQNPQIVLDVTLKRLVQTDNGGLWFVTDARSPGMLLTRADTLNQPLPQIVTSPVTFSGASVLIDGRTTATLFDHTLTPLEQASNVPLNVHADSTYNGSMPYANLISGQQGVLLIQSLPLSQNADKEMGRILLKGVLLT